MATKLLYRTQYTCLTFHSASNCNMMSGPKYATAPEFSDTKSVNHERYAVVNLGVL